MLRRTPSENARVATVDISAITCEHSDASSDSLEDVIQQVKKAVESTGFMILVGHGVPQTVLDNYYEAAKRFFLLPEDTKRAYTGAHPSVCGYSPFKAESVARFYGQTDGAFDPLEKMSFTTPLRTPPDDDNDLAYREFMFPPNDVNEDEALRDTGLPAAAAEYQACMRTLSTTIMKLLARAADLPEEYLLEKCTRNGELVAGSMRCLHYPPLTADIAADSEFRLSPHSDAGAFTVLWTPDDGMYYRNKRTSKGGLEIFVKDRWEVVQHVENSFIVNIADAMERWSNGKWKSTKHRVTISAESSDGNSSGCIGRLAFPFFMVPNHDVIIEALPGTGEPKYDPISLREYLQARLKKLEQT